MAATLAAKLARPRPTLTRAASDGMSYAQPPPQYAQPQYGQPIAQPVQMGAVALPPGTPLVYVRAARLVSRPALVFSVFF